MSTRKGVPVEGDRRHDGVSKKGNTNLAGEGHEVMFAEGENINVTDNDHFIVVLREDRVVDYVCDITSSVDVI